MTGEDLVTFTVLCPICANPIGVTYNKKWKRDPDGVWVWIFTAAFALYPVHEECRLEFLAIQRDRRNGFVGARAIRSERG
jgi:hypothetical protein